MIVPVILSGGAGTRLWPLSRELYPKQLLPLVDERTMLQETACRLAGLSDLSAPLVVCNESHRFMVAEQLRTVGHSPSEIILEPVGRNTAPAVAVAAMQAMAEGYDPVLLVLPADHVIRDSETLRTVIASAKPLAVEGKLITFGIVPTAPETGYGYIRAGDPLEGSRPSSVASRPSKKSETTDNGQRTADPTAYAVAEFVEKPDISTAQKYIESGDYYWNSGMFMFLASSYLKELERFAPAMVAACRKSLDGAARDLDFVRLEKGAFCTCPSDSIDYAVMENTANAAVVPLDAGWSDVGSWSALWEIGEKDAEGNVLSGDVLTKGTNNCFVRAQGRVIAAIGVQDHIIVETPDAVLVAHRDKVQDVKEIVARLKESGREEALLHRRVHRPWGTYECIDKAERYQVKRITVNPGATLSSQMHHHRAEHWVVVKGTAKITCGEKVLLLTENQSTYIPLGITHRLENPGRIPLELIEVQSGSYLGEDDIVRFEDKYGR
jgi:mannose-1-phosphate guanylyltransferase / mannose-6-phosphate isomerase